MRLEYMKTEQDLECARQILWVDFTNVIASQRQLFKVFEPQQIGINFCYLRTQQERCIFAVYTLQLEDITAGLT